MMTELKCTVISHKTHKNSKLNLLVTYKIGSLHVGHKCFKLDHIHIYHEIRKSDNLSYNSHKQGVDLN